MTTTHVMKETKRTTAAAANTAMTATSAVVARKVLCVHAELTAQLLRFATSQLASGGGSNGGPWEDAGRGQVSRKRPRILHSGCGSSTVGVVLQREHGCDVVNADFSKGVMDSMRALYPGCEFIRSDARDAAEFPSQSLKRGFEKGRCDSETGGRGGGVETARKLLDEAARVLATGGKYMIFSAFSNDELGHKDMADMLVHPGFGG
ncbi:unnamed protein product, partial [Ectocarpus sp. 12 AP-2014]